jgi:type IV pilus assembly protein PilV
MLHRKFYPPRQTGSMLLEALIAILIFSMGILALIGLQAASIKLSGDAKYRSDASLLANQLIGQMWVSNRSPATLQANFQGGPQTPAVTNGAAYTAWVADVAAALPGVSGVAANQPTVTVLTQTPAAPATSTSSLVTIHLFWKSPSEQPALPGTFLCGVTMPNPSYASHCFITVAQII